MTVSAIFRHGIPHMRQLIGGLEELLAAQDLDSPAQVRGRMTAAKLSTSNTLHSPRRQAVPQYIAFVDNAHDYRDP